MSEGCEEKFDFEFAKWVLIDGRSKKYKERYENICNKYKDKVIVCRNRDDVRNRIEV